MINIFSKTDDESGNLTNLNRACNSWGFPNIVLNKEKWIQRAILAGCWAMCDEYSILHQCQLGMEYEYEYIRLLIFGELRIWMLNKFEYLINFIEYSNFGKNKKWNTISLYNSTRWVFRSIIWLLSVRTSRVPWTMQGWKEKKQQT